MYLYWRLGLEQIDDGEDGVKMAQEIETESLKSYML